MVGRRVVSGKTNWGEIHDIQQVDGSKQRDALMPMLFDLGLHEALPES